MTDEEREAGNPTGPLCGEPCLEYEINSNACFDCSVMEDLWADLTGEGDQEFLEDHSQG